MKIYDGFTFFNELELLELRLMTLDRVVDYFIIVEADLTHAGEPKEFNLSADHPILTKYGDKIRYIRTSLPHGKNAWPNENFQRNQISQGLYDAEPEDFVMISDLDEIPNPDGILEGINKGWEQWLMEQKLTYYYVNCLAGQNWHGTAILKKKHLSTPQRVRDSRQNPPRVILNGGWHYSFIGGIDRIKTKLESYAETQTNNKDVNNEEHIIKCLETGYDLFGREGDWRYTKKFVPLDVIAHPELKEWLIKYPHMYKETWKEEEQ